MTRSSSQHGLRIGLDLGGSKIEGVLVGRGAKKWARRRVDATRLAWCRHYESCPAFVLVLCPVLIRIRVGEHGFAVEDEQTPATETPTLRRQHAVGSEHGSVFIPRRRVLKFVFERRKRF